MSKFLTPAVRKAAYVVLAAAGAVVVGYGLMSTEQVEQIITLAMAVLGLAMAAANTDTSTPTEPTEPEPPHAIEEDHGSTPGI